MYKVCLVEDEIKTNDLIKKYLVNSGYDVISCYSGEEALNVDEKIDLWILDIMLGGDISGYDVIKKIREGDSLVPVIFSSARDSEIDKVIGFELEADDYITKPYSPKELILRVNRMIKRVYKEDFKKIKISDYSVDLEKREILYNDEKILLTSTEFDLLEVFLSRIGIALSRDVILEKIYGSSYYGSDRNVDEIVRRLRKKMKNLNIETMYGYGYRLLK